MNALLDAAWQNRLEVLAVAFGTVSVWLSVRQKIWSWPTAIVNVLLYVLVFRREKLYADMGLQVIYAILSVYGWYEWLHGGANRTELKVSRCSLRLLGALAVVAVLGTLGLGRFFASNTDAAFPYLDSGLTMTSLVAQYLMTRKVLENWLIWIAADVVYVGLFIYKGLRLTAGLYVVFLVLAIMGYVQWKRSYDLARSSAPTAPGAGGVTRRIVVTGSESTGKTTLARSLAIRLSAPLVPEASRQYAESPARAARPLTAADVEPIARLAVKLDDAVAALAPAVMVLDTDLISTVVYSRHYYGYSAPWIEAAARERRSDLYLLCATDLPWVADGVRDRPEQRAEIDALFRRSLDEFGCTVRHVAGSGSARERAALDAVAHLAPAGHH